MWIQFFVKIWEQSLGSYIYINNLNRGKSKHFRNSFVGVYGTNGLAMLIYFSEIYITQKIDIVKIILFENRIFGGKSFQFFFSYLKVL